MFATSINTSCWPAGLIPLTGCEEQSLLKQSLLKQPEWVFWVQTDATQHEF